MHYYPHNISDFNNATRHLSFVERAIYKELIELQYDLETGLPTDIDWICKRACIPIEHRTDVERMLNEFFDLGETYSNGRCEHEIALYQSKQESARKAGKASGIARRRNKKPNKNNNNEQALNGCLTDVEQTLNQTRNKKQETVTKKQEPKTTFNYIVGQSPTGDAKHCIDHLNKICSSCYTHADSNIKPLLARFKEGHTVDDVINVIDSKHDQWNGTKQEMYLRPKTLFSASNFNNYIGQVGKVTGSKSVIDQFANGGSVVSEQ